MVQLELFETLPAKGRDVVFFGALLPADAGERLMAPVQDRLRRLGVERRVQRSDRLHVSLLRVGFHDRLDDTHVETLRMAAGALDLPPLEIAFTGLMSFGRPGQRGKRPLVLVPGDDARAVLSRAVAIERAVRGRVPLDGTAGGVPHMTLCYAPQRLPPTVLEPPVVLPLSRVALIRSHRGETRYSLLWQT
jgi:2'-5' RNA ligase